MKKHILTTTAAFAATALAVFAQGSLNPPGAPAETMKTLEQIEPRIDLATVAGSIGYNHVINEPGSYYLSEHVEVTVPSGIYINATNVTVDLNGFSIVRASGSGGYGIFINGGQDCATVRNGSIAGFWNGVYCHPSPFAAGCLFEKLAVSGCISYGIYAGTSARITDCRAHDNPGSGIYADKGSSLSGCTAENNLGNYGIYAAAGSTLSDCTSVGNQGAYGIYAGRGSTLSGCTAKDNQGNYGIYTLEGATLIGCTADANQGLYAIYTQDGSHLSGCIAVDNAGSGIYALSGSTLSGCTAKDNEGLHGLHAGQGSTLSGCIAAGNRARYGIHVLSGSVLHGCSAFDNTGTGSDSVGIYAEIGSTVNGCTASYNSNTNSPGTYSQGIGIQVRTGGTVRNCTASFNKGDGIRIERNCLATGNTCNNNGNWGGDGAGIHATSYRNRIDSNLVTANDRGIDVDNSDNLIIRNSASGNTTAYDFVAGNKDAQVLTPGSGFVSTDPWANFSY